MNNYAEHNKDDVPNAIPIRPIDNRAWFDRIDKHGIEVIGIVAEIFGYDQAWLEHIIMVRLSGRKCKCTNFDGAGEIRDYCNEWVAVQRYVDALKELERANKNLLAAENGLTKID